MVSDNASVMQKAADMLEIPFRSCFAHTLNLIVNRGFKQLKLAENTNDLLDDEGEDSDTLLTASSTKPLAASSTQPLAASSTQPLAASSTQLLAASSTQHIAASSTQSLKLSQIISKFRDLVSLFNRSDAVTKLLKAQEIREHKGKSYPPVVRIQDVSTRYLFNI
jgi:hypothetical protein